MTPIIIRNRRSTDFCSVTRGGIGMTTGVVEQAGWRIGDPLEVGFIAKAKCILLRCVTDTEHSDQEGFRLAYSNKPKSTGGRVYCVAFIRNYLQTLVELPKKNLVPVFLRDSEWAVALPLEPIDWAREDFSKAGVNKISRGAVGAYELLGTGDAVLRVGEGKIKDRMNAHLNDRRFAPPTVKTFRYLDLENVADGKILEKIRIEQYSAQTGVLPRFQEIRS